MGRRESEKLNGHRAERGGVRDNESKRRVCVSAGRVRSTPPPLFQSERFENGRVPSVKVGRTRAKHGEGQRYAQGLNSDENSAVVKGFASSTSQLASAFKGVHCYFCFWLSFTFIQLPSSYDRLDRTPLALN